MKKYILLIIICCIALTTFSQQKSEINYALVTKIFTAGKSPILEIDIVQMLTGEKAINAAKQKGEAEYNIQSGDTAWYVPNDYYILNDNTKRRKIWVSERVVIFLIRKESSKLSKGTFNEFRKIHPDKIFRLTILAQSVIRIEELYMP